jgi:DNA-binding LacI/PurR family transcriptional regulator
VASLKDVARLAGVSPSTVSRVVNRSIPVDDATRLRVEQAVRELGYRPNLLAKGLRMKSGALIGLVVPGVIHHTFASFVQYVEDACSERGFHLIVGNNMNNPDREEAFIDALVRRHVDGIIFSRVSDESRALRILSGAEIPVVIIDRALADEELPCVVLDNRRAGELAADHLLDLGHRRIGSVTGPLKIALCRERLAGFREALARRGAGEPAVVEGDFHFPRGREAARELRASRPDLTAVWAQNDLMAVGVLNELAQAGISVPGDVSVLGMDDTSLCDMTMPALTTVAQPFARISEAAVDLLLRQRAGTAVKNEKVVVAPCLVVRGSTAPVRA